MLDYGDVCANICEHAADDNYDPVADRDSFVLNEDTRRHY